MPLPHQNLIAWRRADDLFIEVHLLTLQRFRRTSASSSAPSCAAPPSPSPQTSSKELLAKHDRERSRFFNLAAASSREVGYGLHASSRLGYIQADELAEFERKLQFIGAPLSGLIRKHREKESPE